MVLSMLGRFVLSATALLVMKSFHLMPRIRLWHVMIVIVYALWLFLLLLLLHRASAANVKVWNIDDVGDIELIYVHWLPTCKLWTCKSRPFASESNLESGVKIQIRIESSNRIVSTPTNIKY